MPLAYSANLPEPSNQDQGEVEVISIIYENQVPQVPDFFEYVNKDTIEIPNENFSGANFYEFSYNRLTQLESEILDLGSDFLNYEWYLDVCAYVRKDLSTKQEVVTEQLRLVDGIEAVLENPALTTGNFSLTRTNGVITEELPPSAVIFINNSRIQIANNFFNVGFIYTFTYTSLVIERNPTVSLIYEYRSAISTFEIQNKEWEKFQVNDVADTRFSLADPNNKRYIQFRITANNIKRVEDLHIYSVTARGIPTPQSDVDVINCSLNALLLGNNTASGVSNLTGVADGISLKANSSASLIGTADGEISSLSYGYGDWVYLVDFAEYGGSGNLNPVVGPTLTLNGSAPTSGVATGLSGIPNDSAVSFSGATGYFRATSMGLSLTGFAVGEGIHIRAIYDNAPNNAELASFGARTATSGISYAIVELTNPSFTRSRLYNNNSPSDHVQNHGTGWILRDVVITRTALDQIDFVTYSNGVTDTTTFVVGTFDASTVIDLSEATFGAGPTGAFVSNGSILMFGVRSIGTFTSADHNSYRSLLGL